MTEGEDSLIFTNIPEPPNISAPMSNNKIPFSRSLDIFFSSFKILSYTFVYESNSIKQSRNCFGIGH